MVCQMLTDTISSVDDGIAQALYDIFPDPSALDGLSDDAIRNIINDSDRGGKSSAAILRCMRGTTVLVSLFDVQTRHLWVASLGDCVAGTSTYTFSWLNVDLIMLQRLAKKMERVGEQLSSVSIIMEPMVVRIKESDVNILEKKRRS